MGIISFFFNYYVYIKGLYKYSIGIPKQEQIFHSEKTIFTGVFFTAQPHETAVDAVEGADNDAGGLSSEVKLQEPDATH